MWSRLCWALGSVVAVIIFVSPAEAQQTPWRIASFEAQVAIQKDGSLRVTETIAADFGVVQKHGIFREIPFAYTDGATKEYLTLTTVEVLQDGRPAKYEETRNRTMYRLKIGDPDTTISGLVTYRLTYTVVGALRAFDRFDELYWNVTGDNWEVPIGTASATVTLPAEKVLQSACYQGALGSRTSCQSVSGAPRVASFASGPLEPGQQFTVAVGFTKGMVPIIRADAPPVPFLWLGVAMMVFGFAVMPGYYVFKWLRRGRDQWYVRRSGTEKESQAVTMPLFARETIVPEYKPPLNLRPAEVGIVLDERADTLDFSATIVDLAIRGYITITEIPKKWLLGSSDYKLTRTTLVSDALLSYEQQLLTALFTEKNEVLLSELRATFYKELKVIQQLAYQEVTAKGLFIGNPDKVRSSALLVPMIILVISGFLIGLLLAYQDRYFMLAFGFGAIAFGSLIGVILGALMPRRSAKGREARRGILGYELFLNQTEKYRQPFLENQNLFLDVLPYAMIFGVTRKLASAMEQIGVAPAEPGWYHGATPWNPIIFTQGMERVSAAMNTAISTSPSGSGSGGGGFSGGGFGGGGGGSW